MISLIRPTSQVIVCTARMYVLCTYKRSYAHIIITKCIFSLITLTRQATHLDDKIEQTTQLVVQQTYLVVIPSRENTTERSNSQISIDNKMISALRQISGTALVSVKILSPNQLLMLLLVIESLCSLC